MRNPWTTKKPFMSAWFSSANKAMGSARGQTAAATKRQLAAIQAETTQHAPAFVADAFCRSRLDGLGQHRYGALPVGLGCAAIIERGAVAT